MLIRRNKNKKSVNIKEMAVFSMLGTVMFCSKIIMEAFPNIHLLGMLTITYTIVYRKKALIPIYIYVMLNGLYSGFSMWWFPYLYIWTILWALTMLLPRRLPEKVKYIVYPLLCGIHGFAFGALYAPAQALMFGFDFNQMVAWIIMGLPFDFIHGVGNFLAGLLVMPLAKALQKLTRKQKAD